jgi:uncharacterized protein YdaU (DUF1376 family)
VADSSNKTDAWMPLWIGAYLADTMRLTTAQHGAYLLLLMAYWRERAPLPDDDDELRSIARADKAEWKKLRPALERYFTVADGVWHHKRVAHELASAEARQKAAAAKAAKASQARWGDHPKHAPKDVDKHVDNYAPGMPEAMPQGMLEDMHEECPTPTPTPCIQPFAQKIETSVSVGLTHFSDEFQKVIEARPELDAGWVWLKFIEHYPKPKRTLTRWREWVLREQIPSPGGQGGPAPVPAVDAAALTRARIAADDAKVVPMPDAVRLSLAALAAKAKSRADAGPSAAEA